MRRIFLGFCRNWSLMSTVHYLSSSSDFGFEFAEIFVLKNQLPAITDTGSRQLRVSVIRRKLSASLIRGVANSPHHWNAELATTRITDTESRLLNFLNRKLSVSMIQRVGDPPHQWYGESPTPRIVESESRQLCVSQIQRVDDSAYHWVGELTTPRNGDTGVAFKEKINLVSIFWTFNS